MPRTQNGDIEYWYKGEYREEYGHDGNSAVAMLHTRWNDYDAFPEAMLGSVGIPPGGVGLTRKIPEVHRTRNWMFCTSLRLLGSSGAVGESANDGSILFFDPVNPGSDEYAAWEATFAGVPWYVTEDDEAQKNELYRYIQRLHEYSGEFVQNPGNTWKFDSPQQRELNEPVNVPFQTEAITYRWMWVPFVQVSGSSQSWSQAINTVNSVDFDPDFWAIPAGQLLFLGFHLGDPVRDPLGGVCYHVDMSFIRRFTGWQAFFRNDIQGVGPGFDTVHDKQTGQQTPFKTQDHNELFV